jgi:hypothetical protein
MSLKCAVEALIDFLTAAPRPATILTILADTNVNTPLIELNSARRLGAFEELFWLYDQSSPAHFTVTAEIAGFVDHSDWRRALNDLQRRHPMMRVGVDPKTRHFKPTPNTAIPLRVISDPTATWLNELRREISMPFIADGAPLIRAVLLHAQDRATLILVAHHSIADALSLVFAVRDLLQSLARISLSEFSPVDSQEDAFGFPPLGTARAIACDRERAALETLPDIEFLRFSPIETTTLINVCRERETSVQAALCAAVAIAGRSISTNWRGTIKLVSPVSTRAWTGAAEQCSLSIIPATVNFEANACEDFWMLAKKTREDLRQTQSREAVAATIGAVHNLMSTQLDVATMADFMEANFLSEGMVSNLGVVPLGTEFGSLRLTALWGPATLVVGSSSQTIGALTFGEALHLTHTSRELIPGLLEEAKNTLIQHCLA